MATPDVSIILPTYKEAKNLPVIIPGIAQILKAQNLNGEIIVVDDNSPDGTYSVASELSRQYPVRPVLRKKDRGLSQSVMAGFSQSNARVCVVMDADGSHPISTLPDMIHPILSGKYDISVGSRNIPGGGSEHWPVHRRIVSRVAGLMGIALCKMTDPTTGYMAVNRDILKTLSLNPIGWKIVLEVVVKANTSRFAEVPITFNDRVYDKSKMNMKAQWLYVRHLFRLYTYKYKTLAEFVIFSGIGLLGMLVDMSVVVLLKNLFALDIRVLAIFGFIAAVSHNYYLNWKLNFKVLDLANPIKAWASFVGVCLLGLSIRLMLIQGLITTGMFDKDSHYIQLNFMGILLATLVNFFGSKLLIFRERKK